MQEIQYAFREDEKSIALLIQGTTAACPISQIVSLRKREIAPVFLGQFLGMDIKGTQYPATAISEYGKAVSTKQDCHYYYTKIDSQIEFIVKPRVMQKLSEFIPGYTGSGLYNYFDGQPYGFLVVLRVYRSEQRIPEEMLKKGRQGSAQVIALYDESGERIEFSIPDTLTPVVEDGAFEQIKEEIIHILRVENAFIGIYGIDKESISLLKKKREVFNDNQGRTRWTYNEDDDIDRAIIDYADIYRKVIRIDPSLRWFIEYVRGIKPPQMVEIQALLPKAISGDSKSRDRIIEMYLRNIIRIALYYSEKHHLSLSDTIQEGVIGLEIAIDKFEASESTTFQQYFPLWVRQVILREMPSHLYTRHFPVHIHDKILAIKEVASNEGYSFPDDNDLIREDDEIIRKVSEQTGLSQDRIVDLLQYMSEDVSLELLFEQYEENGDIDNALILKEDDILIEDVTNTELRIKIEKCLMTLTDRERKVLQLRYGLDDGKCKTLEEIGNVLAVTRERIRQIEAKALRKLRRHSIIKSLEGYLGTSRTMVDNDK